MFRLLGHQLPKDPKFPADLGELGYYINEHDQIRSKARPDQDFNFFISKNERVCERQRESMNDVIRENVGRRLAALGLKTVDLPSARAHPFVPILYSENIASAKRLILYFGESNQDLGIFAYRSIGQVSIAAGSAIEFVTNIQDVPEGAEAPGIVIGNCGQLIFHRNSNRAVTQQTWYALPRATGMSQPYRVDSHKNHPAGNETPEKHIDFVLSWIKKHGSENVKIDVVGLGDTVEGLVKVLRRRWGEFKKNISAIAIGSGMVWLGEERSEWSEEFADFWAGRARAYLISQEPLDTPLTGRDEFGCNCYSSGETTYVERIMPMAHKKMLGFFNLAADTPGYREPEETEFPDGQAENELTMDHTAVVTSSA